MSDVPENPSDIDKDEKVGAGETAQADLSVSSAMIPTVSAVVLASTVGGKLRAAREAARQKHGWIMDSYLLRRRAP